MKREKENLMLIFVCLIFVVLVNYKYFEEGKFKELLLNDDIIDYVELDSSPIVIVESLSGGAGSGVFISEEIILTCYHIAKEEDTTYIRLADGNVFIGDVFKKDIKRDLSLIRIIGTKSDDYIKIGNVNLERGDEIYTIGHPSSKYFSFFHGYVSNLNISIKIKDRTDIKNGILLDMTGEAGLSGSPILNMEGKVAGIIIAKSSKVDGMTYAVGIDDIIKFIGE